MDSRENHIYYILALAVSIGLVFHGASFLTTLNDTYDIFVHIFFGDHYRRSWFDPWEPKWYTGFSLISYPPMVHQLIALLSFISGLKFAAYILAFCIVALYVTGSYRFSKLISGNKESAAYSALVAVFLPSVIEAFHVFGQIPMMMGISWLLHALPEIFQYVRFGKIRHYFSGISLIAVAVCSHHVTPIFGMVFFVVPLMATAVMDGAKEEAGSYKAIGLLLFIKYVKKFIGRIVFFGGSTVFVAVFVILPYWIWSKSDPIAQVPIPHGSRDNFIEVFSSGLVFFILPWGFLLLMLPFYFYRFFSKRNIFLGLSFTMLFILGTGGTTPITKMLLGENAFNILTLERFTFWATIYAMPMTGEFLWRFTKGDIFRKIMLRRNTTVHSLYTAILIICIFFSAGFTTNLSFFRPLQPDPINLIPLKNFLKSDKHDKWRFLTLGFGDQMAWLSSNTDALTIDGNYHSARRVPELTTRAIERLENSKYRGIEGIVTLQQFLSTPETFHLKYILSNDKFYDPILYFSGWHRVKLLPNGIMVWERSDVSSLPAILPKKDIPTFQKVMWGVIPMTMLFFAFFFNVQIHWVRHVLGRSKDPDFSNPEELREIIEPIFYQVIKYWIVMILTLALILIANLYWVNIKQTGHERVVTSYYDALDFKRFIEAHSFLDPSENISLDYFLLEISVTDGLLDSYGKINNIVHRTLEKREDYAKIETKLEYVTPMKTVFRTEVNEVIKKGWKWYIKPTTTHNYIPTDQFSIVSKNHFINQGRRTITTEETFHEDVLDRPVTIVRQARLIKRDTSYHVVGLLQNLDSYPVDLTIKASLLDSMDNQITSYYDQYDLVHKLMPKEVTGFRIDFEDVKWIFPDKDQKKKMTPTSFKIEVLGSVINQDLYKKVVVQEVAANGDEVRGKLYNYGEMTSTVTQIVQSHFDQKKNLMWVETNLTDESVFPKKRAPFSFQPDPLECLEVIEPLKKPMIKINGLDNEDITRKYQPENIRESGLFFSLRPDTYTIFSLNNFIGNPAPF
ncbi:MAG: hypothetical protein AAGA66_13565 [Bacteroidota bacterium]